MASIKKKLQMKKILFTLVIVAYTIIAMGQKSQTLEKFTGISTSGDIKVMLINTSGKPRIEYTVVKGEEENFSIAVQNETLKLTTKNSNWITNTKIEAKVYYNSLNKVSTSAGSSVQAESKISSPSMSLSASSGSALKLDVASQNTSISASSGATIKLMGTAGNGSVSVSSGGSINSNELTFSTINATASSGGYASFSVTDELVANTSSGGSISYTGEPKKVTKNKSTSGGSINKK
jgi:hypothetical protein